MVLKYIVQAKANGIAVIFITHNVHHAWAVGDAFTILNRGRSYGTFLKSETNREKLLGMMAGGEELEKLAVELDLIAKRDTGPGALCQIDCSRRTGYGYDERIEAFGSKGMVESRRQRFRGVSRYLGDKVIEDGLHAGWFERIEESYYQALDAFVGAISKGIQPSPSLEDGLKAQLLADKATESLKSGQPVKFAK